jgi:PAS domain S-box-containing protein
MAGSVLAGLSAMQARLRSFEAGRQLAEDSVRASLERLNEAQHLARVGSWSLDPRTRELAWSDEVFKLFELDPGIQGANFDTFLAVVHPDDRKALARVYQDSLETREPYELVHRLRMPDGRIKWVHERAVTEFDDSGAALRSQGTVQDVTESKLAEIALRQSERKFSMAFESCPVAASIAAVDDGRFIDVNANFQRDFGWSKDDLIGRTSVEVGIWPDKATREIVGCRDGRGRTAGRL